MRLDRLGDLVLTLPAIYSVHNNFPNADIDLVVNRQLVGLVDNISFIRKIYSINPYKFYILELLKLIFSLRINKYDMAIDLLPRASHLSSVVLFAIKSKNKIGVAVGLRKYVINFKVHLTKKIKYQRDVVFEILEHLGLSVDKKVNMIIDKSTQNYVQDFFQTKKITKKDVVVGLSPGASEEFKMWPAKNFGELIKKISKNCICKFVLLGSKKEKSLCQEINNFSENLAINAAGFLDIKQLCACINNLDLFIGNNSGPMHIAHTLDTPSIIISGFANPKRWTLPKPNFIVVHKDTQDFESNQLAASDISSITVDDVFNETEKLLRLCKKGALCK